MPLLHLNVHSFASYCIDDDDDGWMMIDMVKILYSIIIGWLSFLLEGLGQITLIIFNNHIIMSNGSNNIIMSIVQCQPPSESSLSKLCLSRKWQRPRFLPKRMGSMFECVTKVCRTQNSVCQQNSRKSAPANCKLRWKMFTNVHRSQRNWRIDDKGRHWKKYSKR